MINFLEKTKIITRQYYASIERELKEISLKRWWKPRAVVFFLQDNTPVHTAQVAEDEATYNGFELLSHSPYSDLGSFNLFPKT